MSKFANLLALADVKSLHPMLTSEAPPAMANYHTTYNGQRVLVKVLPPQYDPEPPIRPVFKFIHGPVTRHGCRQSCYTVAIGAPA